MAWTFCLEGRFAHLCTKFSLTLSLTSIQTNLGKEKEQEQVSLEDLVSKLTKIEKNLEVLNEKYNVDTDESKSSTNEPAK